MKFTAAAPTGTAGRDQAGSSREGEAGQRVPTQADSGEVSPAPLLSRAEAPGPAPPSLPDPARTQHVPNNPHHDSSDPRPLAYSEAAAAAPLLRPPPQPHATPSATAFSFYYKPAAIAQSPGATGGHRPGAPHAGSCSSSIAGPPRSWPGNAADWDYSSQEPLRREGR